MKIIVPYKQIQRMVDFYLPNDIGLFGWGNEYELKRQMQVKPDSYPILWYVVPNGDNNQIKNGNWMETNVNLFLATNTRKDWLNPQREVETFDAYLTPVMEKIVKMFYESKNTSNLSDSWTINQLPGYYRGDGEGELNAYWDVLTLSFNARIFNKECLNIINF